MKKIGILIELEPDTGKPKTSCFEIITLARQKNSELFAFVINGNIKAIKADLEYFGITTIVDISLAPGLLHNPDARAKTVAGAVKELRIDTVFGLSTPGGKDILPRMAAIFDAPLIMDCIDIDLQTEDGLQAKDSTTTCTAKTSQYSGKTVATIKTRSDIHIFGIRPNSVEPRKNKTHAQTIKFDPPDFMENRFQIIKRGKPDKNADINLAEAEIIVAGGRGMKNSENFTALFQCARALHAATGASRVAVDEGWVPYAMQVGQTGEKVNPKVYIAFGISGSIQHFAGMKTSGMVIAINLDKNAPIVSNCDYYVVADAMEVIKELTRLLKDKRE